MLPPEQGRNVGSSEVEVSWSHRQGPSGFIGQYPFGWVHSWCVDAVRAWWTSDWSGSVWRPTTRTSRAERTRVPRDQNDEEEAAVTVLGAS